MKLREKEKMKKTKKHQKFLSIAKKVARESEFERFRHGAVLVKGGSVISFSFNKNKFCPFAQRFRSLPGIPTVHAEVGCILGLPRSITTNADVYVVRLGSDNTVRLSKPCQMCQSCLSHVGVKRIFYSIEQGESVGVMKL